MRYLASFASAAAMVLVMLAGSVSAQANDLPDLPANFAKMGNLANGRKIFTEGKGDAVPACASCHGDLGLGDDSMGTPRLADQVFTYEVKELDDFASGKRTDLTLNAMNDIAKGLTQQDRRDVSAYVHTLHSNFAGSDLRALAKSGTKIGDRSRGAMIVIYGLDTGHGQLPACKSCHGFDGRSAGRIFPMIGGQRFVYLVNQLHYWRNGFEGKPNARTNDPMRMMEKVAGKLTDEDILDLASYLTSAKPFTPGNPMQPPRDEW